MVLIRDEQFFTISEAGSELGVETHTLRFWEKEFKDFLKPLRNGRGNRLYSRADMETLGRIRDLLSVELYTIPGARRQMYIRHRENSA